MKIFIASDHKGVELKKKVSQYISMFGIDIVDIGTNSYDIAVDYPIYAHKVARAVVSGECDQGILICSTGQGMVITANKIPGVRAALCHDAYNAHQSRAHNNANILCLGASLINSDNVSMILDQWLNTDFEGGIHKKRVDLIELFEVDETIYELKIGVALSPTSTRFGPILFAGDFDRGLAAAAENGFCAIEVSLRSAKGLDREWLKNQLIKYNFDLSAIATGQACIEDTLCLANSKSQIVNATIDHLKKIIIFASYFNAMVIIGGIRGRLTGSDREKSMQSENAINAIGECALFAKKFDITLLIEPINRYETNFINSASQGLDVIKQVGENNIKLLLDTFHMNIEEVNIENTLIAMKDYIGYIHVADNNRYAPGQGHLEFHKILSKLSEINYKGYVTAEILPIPDDETAMKSAGEYLGNLIGKKPLLNNYV